MQEQKSNVSASRRRLDRKALLLFGVMAIVFVVIGLATGWALFQVGGPLGPVPTATPTSTYTPSPTNTSTPIPSMPPTNTATSTPTATSTATATATATFTATPTATFTATPTNTPTATATPTATDTPVQIFTHVRTMGKLVLMSFELARADIHVGINRGACSHGADHVAETVIEAGVDFSGIKQEYDRDADTYTLKVAPPFITSCQVRYIEQYDRSRTICGTDWGEVMDLGAVQSMPAFVERALNRGILDKAQAHAEIVLGSFVQTLTESPVHIDFAERVGEPALPETCRPEAPDGWRYDETIETWSHGS